MGKTKKKPDQHVTATLVQFDRRFPPDESVRVKYNALPFDEVLPMRFDDYRPGGGTPLMDAVGRTITHLDRALDEHPDDVHIGFVLDESGSMGSLRKTVVDGYNEFVGSIQGVKPDGGPGRVMLVVFTDGQENASTEYTAEQIKELIDERESGGRWTFIYMGANQDAWHGAGAAGLSTSVGSVMNYSATPTGTSAAFANVARRGREYTQSSTTYNSLAASMGDTVEDPGTP